MIQSWRTHAMVAKRLEQRRLVELAAQEVMRMRRVSSLSTLLYAFAWFIEMKGAER